MQRLNIVEFGLLLHTLTHLNTTSFKQNAILIFK